VLAAFTLLAAGLVALLADATAPPSLSKSN
jgi:hypothetical protein